MMIKEQDDLITIRLNINQAKAEIQNPIPLAGMSQSRLFQKPRGEIISKIKKIEGLTQRRATGSWDIDQFNF